MRRWRPLAAIARGVGHVCVEALTQAEAWRSYSSGHFGREVIMPCVRWHLRFEPGLSPAHTIGTIGA